MTDERLGRVFLHFTLQQSEHTKFMAVGDCIQNCPTAGGPDKKTLKLVIPSFDLAAHSVLSSFPAAVLPS